MAAEPAPLTALAQGILEVCETVTDGVRQAEITERFQEKSTAEITEALNEIIMAGRLIITDVEGDYYFRAATTKEQEVIKKLDGLGDDERILYQQIKQADKTGIWTKPLATRTGLPTTRFNKAIRKLENRKLVKMFKPPDNKTKKFYILFDLEPEIENPMWYDETFLAVVAEICYRKLKEVAGEDKSLAPEDICAFINKSNISKIPLEPNDISRIVRTLIYDGKAIEVANPAGGIAYRASLQQGPVLNGFTETPCGVCPVFSECSEDGIISPQTCVYMKAWLW